MIETVTIDQPLQWQDIAAIARGARIALSPATRKRLLAYRQIVDALVEKGIRGYGINTGVGALCDVIISRDQQQAFSRNILMSHAAGVGQPLSVEQTRAILAAEINNLAHGPSGIKLETVDLMCALLNRDCIPLLPSQGSVGYINHTASIGLVLIGSGKALFQGEALPGAEALKRAGLAPVVLEAKEGLSLVNGSPCATGLAALAISRLAHLIDWADAAAALTYENLGSQIGAFAEAPMGLRKSPGLQVVAANLRAYLDGSALLAQSIGSRTQDPLSLRAVPHIHGAVRDSFDHIAATINRELASVTDNPVVGGTRENPQVHSQAHAVAADLGLAVDALAVAAAELAAISERRLDRLVNPLVSGLPAFLAASSGVASGFMIAQYSAAGLVAENRRLAAPSSLDGGVTSGLQEDILVHPNAGARKCLAILDNLEYGLAIELTAAAQAYDLQSGDFAKAPKTQALYDRIRAVVSTYADDRPMTYDLETVRELVRGEAV